MAVPCSFCQQLERGKLVEGPAAMRINGREMEAVVVKIAINVVRQPGSSTNELPTFFEAGLAMRLERQAGGNGCA